MHHNNDFSRGVNGAALILPLVVVTQLLFHVTCVPRMLKLVGLRTASHPSFSLTIANCHRKICKFLFVNFRLIQKQGQIHILEPKGFFSLSHFSWYLVTLKYEKPRVGYFQIYLCSIENLYCIVWDYMCRKELVNLLFC